MVVFLETFIKIGKVVKAAGICGLRNFVSLAKQKGGLPDPVLIQILVKGSPACFPEKMHKAGRTDTAKICQGFNPDLFSVVLMNKIEYDFQPLDPKIFPFFVVSLWVSNNKLKKMEQQGFDFQFISGLFFIVYIGKGRKGLFHAAVTVIIWSDNRRKQQGSVHKGRKVKQ